MRRSRQRRTATASPLPHARTPSSTHPPLPHPHPIPAPRSYNATFQRTDEPCDVPLRATNEARLVVDNPGDAPLPVPQATTVTIAFTGCQKKSGARVAQVVPFINATIKWGITKQANASVLRLGRGETGVVAYTVTVDRRPPDVSYFVGGAVFASPQGGVLGGPPQPVQSIRVRLSSGDEGPATCLPPMPDGATPCRFDGIPYSIGTPAPVAGNVSAEITLTDGTVLTAPATPFDFSNVPVNAADGGRAALTDAFEPAGLAAAIAAGIRVESAPSRKPPGSPDAPLFVAEDGVFSYNVRVRAGDQCGRFKLANTARLVPVGPRSKPVAARTGLAVEVVGCRR
jgi:hypothetical protein